MPTFGYFDYNATTPMCQEASRALSEALNHFGNPSSLYKLAKQNRNALATARQQVARLMNCASAELVFTSGGTEANNWAIKGALLACGAIGRVAQPTHIIISAIEHSSVLEIAEHLKRVFGFEITLLTPDKEGIVSAERVRTALRDTTRVVSIMLMNNEVGTLQPVSDIAQVLHGRAIHFHVDGVQAVGKIPVDVKALGIDTLSFAGHKFCGPKGVGGLYVRSGVVLEPLLHGGGQEGGLRGGTEASALVTAMGVAADVAATSMPETIARMSAYRTSLIQQLQQRIDGVTIHGSADKTTQAPNTLSVRIEGIRAESLAALLDQLHGIQVSLGSACSNNGSKSLSHVLLAMGLSEAAIESTMRVSLGPLTTQDSLERFVSAVEACVNTLRRISGEAQA
ncbi:cysteine desulfurase family protein [Pseudomonas yamanorum]